jgi:hypothetical protein
LQQISVCKPIRKNFLDRRQRGIGLPIKQTPRTQNGVARQFLVACSWLQINNFKIRQTSAEVAIRRSLVLANAMFKVAVEEKPAGRFTIRSRR